MCQRIVAEVQEVEAVQEVVAAVVTVDPVEARHPRRVDLMADLAEDPLHLAPDRMEDMDHMGQRVLQLGRMDMENLVLRRLKGGNHTVIQKPWLVRHRGNLLAIRKASQ